MFTQMHTKNYWQLVNVLIIIIICLDKSLIGNK